MKIYAVLLSLLVVPFVVNAQFRARSEKRVSGAKKSGSVWQQPQ
jgi:hypothetical protein